MNEDAPESVLFELLHVDGKERILPVLRETETFHQQMQQLAAQNEQLMAENQQLNQGIANLQQVVDELTGGGTGEPMMGEQPPVNMEGGVPNPMMMAEGGMM